MISARNGILGIFFAAIFLAAFAASGTSGPPRNHLIDGLLVKREGESSPSESRSPRQYFHPDKDYPEELHRTLLSYEHTVRRKKETKIKHHSWHHVRTSALDKRRQELEDKNAIPAEIRREGWNQAFDYLERNRNRVIKRDILRVEPNLRLHREAAPGDYLQGKDPILFWPVFV